MLRRAKGKKSVAISDITGFEVPYRKLKTTWNGLKVEPEEYDHKQPQLTPRKNIIDAVALFKPRADADQEEIAFFVGYNYSLTQDRNKINVGIAAKGTIGNFTISVS